MLYLLGLRDDILFRIADVCLYFDVPLIIFDLSLYKQLICLLLMQIRSWAYSGS